MENVYYVYTYNREDGTPYYVGKGKGRRAYSKDHCVKLPKDMSRIVLIHENMTEAEAHSKEIELIALYGRKDNGTGILRNLTDGGDGASGVIRSEEYKAKISAAKKGKFTGENSPFYGKKRSEEVRAKISAAKCGEKNPMKRPEVRAKITGENNSSKRPEVRAKISAAMKGKNVGENNPAKRPEVRAKISAAMKDKNPAKRPEVRAKISAANKGKKLSEEHKAKISANSGMKRPEVRAKFSAANSGQNNPMSRTNRARRQAELATGNKLYFL